MIGEKVICVDDDYLKKHGIKIKIGDQFKVTDMGKDNNGSYYRLVSDTGQSFGWIRVNCFKPVSEFRNEKLEEFGII